MSWNYNPNDYQEKSFSIIPAGDHRVRIADVEEVTFRSGNGGYKFTFEVSGNTGKVFHNFVLDQNNPKMTNQRIGEFFDSFGITSYEMGSGEQWIGKTGAVRVKHEEYDGKTQVRVSFFIQKSRQDKLPAWEEPNNGGASASWSQTTEVPTPW